MTLRTLNYGNYGIFLIMGHAGFCPSTVGPKFVHPGFRLLDFGCFLRASFYPGSRSRDSGFWVFFVEGLGF